MPFRLVFKYHSTLHIVAYYSLAQPTFLRTTLQCMEIIPTHKLYPFLRTCSCQQLSICSYKAPSQSTETRLYTPSGKGKFCGLSQLLTGSLVSLSSHSAGKRKGKFHPITGHEGPEGEQMYSCTLPSISALDGGGWSTPRPGRFTPGKHPVPIVQEAGWVFPVMCLCIKRLELGANQWPVPEIKKDLICTSVTVPCGLQGLLIITVIIIKFYQ